MGGEEEEDEEGVASFNNNNTVAWRDRDCTHAKYTTTTT